MTSQRYEAIPEDIGHEIDSVDLKMKVGEK
jgi:hypothetical protein